MLDKWAKIAYNTHISQAMVLRQPKPLRSDEMKDVTTVAKTVKANLKALGITAKAKSSRGWMMDAIYVTVSSELVKTVYDLTRKYETDNLVIIVQA